MTLYVLKGAYVEITVNTSQQSDWGWSGSLSWERNGNTERYWGYADEDGLYYFGILGRGYVMFSMIVVDSVVTHTVTLISNGQSVTYLVED